MRRIVVGGVATLGLAWAGVSGAHGPSHQPGYVSTVMYVQPAVPGLTATVLGGDQLLSVRNWTNRTLVVLDAHGRPAYRLGADGVSRRVGTTWRLMKRGSSYTTWHDPRIHWQGADPPEVVEQAPDEIHRIAAWRVPGTLDGRRFVIHGSLGWVPEPRATPRSFGIGTGTSVAIVFTLGGVAAAGVYALWATRRRTSAL